MNNLPTLFSNVRNPEPVLLPALNAAFAAIEKTGGKIIASLTALPTYGPGRLFLRDDGKQQGDAEKKLFTTEHPQWKKIAEKMVAAGVGADFFLTAPAGGYLDVATIGMLGDSRTRLSLMIYRSRLRKHRWRNILLFEFCLSTR
jgi:protein transport protein SEC24